MAKKKNALEEQLEKQQEQGEVQTTLEVQESEIDKYKRLNSLLIQKQKEEGLLEAAKDTVKQIKGGIDSLEGMIDKLSLELEYGEQKSLLDVPFCFSVTATKADELQVEEVLAP